MSTTSWCPAELLRDPKFEGHEHVREHVDRCFGQGAYAGLVAHEELLGITLLVEHQTVGNHETGYQVKFRYGCRVDFTDGDYIKKVVG